MNGRRISAVIFDMDGTLLNTGSSMGIGEMRGPDGDPRYDPRRGSVWLRGRGRGPYKPAQNRPVAILSFGVWCSRGLSFTYIYIYIECLLEQLTKDLLKEFLAKYGKVVDMEKENKRLGTVHHESAIGIVKDYDLPMTPQQYSQRIMPMYHHKWLQAKALPGVNRLIKHLHKHGIPYAVASNSIKKNVEVKVSAQKGWKEYFSIILGSDEVKSGKPSPDLFLEAANKMGVDASCCLVIEDSVVGIKAGKAAKMQVVAVPSIQSESDQYSIADHVIHSFLDFQPELWALPPFDDWVMKALPIEPIHFKGSYKNGFLQESSDNEASDLPGQAWGVYFGWIKVESQERLKIVVSIRWEHSCGAFRRNIQACFINGSDGQICDQLTEVTLVGYIRGFHPKQNLSSDAQISDEDKSIAETCLDLAAYDYHGCSPSKN